MTRNARARKPTAGWCYLLPEVAAPLGGGLIKIGQASTWAAVSVGLAPYVIAAALYGIFVVGYVPAVICYLCTDQTRQESVDRLITTSSNAIVSLLTLTPAEVRVARAPRTDTPAPRGPTSEAGRRPGRDGPDQGSAELDGTA